MLFSVRKRNFSAVLYVVPRHAICSIYHFANKHFVLAGESALAGVTDIETQPVRIREVPAWGRIINLCNILDLESPAKNDWPEGTRQVYQIKPALITIEYM
jgi:hypothetical protein